MRSLIPAFGLTGIILLAILALTAWPADRGYAVAVFAPTDSTHDIVVALFRADARLIDSGGLPGTVIVYSEQSGLPQRLRQAGAFLVFNPLSGAGCGGSSNAVALPLTQRES